MVVQSSAKNKQYGWIVVIISFLIMALQFAPFATLPGLFVTSLVEEFATTRTAITFSFTIAILATLVGMMVFSHTYARFKIRQVMPVALLICAGTYFANYFVTNIMQFYVVSAVRGFLAAGLSTLPISIIVNNWFGASGRGKAVGIAMAGSGVGAMIFSPITGYIINTYSWRWGYVIFGVMCLVLLPLILLFFTQTPEEKGFVKIGQSEEEAQSSANHQQTGPGAKIALRTSTFWLAALSMLLLAGASQTWNNNAASYFNDIGISPVVAASILSITSLGLIVGKLGFGVISDKYGIKVSMLLGAGAFIFTYAFCIVIARLPGLVFIPAVSAGLAMSIVTIAPTIMTSDLFGNKGYAILMGYLQMGCTIGSSFIPLGMTLIFDSTGSFTSAWYIAIGLSFVGIVSILMAFSKKLV